MDMGWMSREGEPRPHTDYQYSEGDSCRYSHSPREAVDTFKVRYVSS